MPAFMAAVAASECGEDAVAMVREAEGGSELISGGIAIVCE
jgi:hypothetical protein